MGSLLSFSGLEDAFCIEAPQNPHLKLTTVLNNQKIMEKSISLPLSRCPPIEDISSQDECYTIEWLK